MTVPKRQNYDIKSIHDAHEMGCFPLKPPSDPRIYGPGPDWSIFSESESESYS